MDAFGRVKEFNDIGNRVKAIIALGRQDCAFEELIPFEQGITILGKSSDHTILDVTDYCGQLVIGDIIKFKTTYLANLKLGTSCYVKKEFLEDGLVKKNGYEKRTLGMKSVLNRAHSF